MKSKLKLLCAVMFFTGIVLTGCGNNADNSNVENFTQIEQKSSNIFRNVPSLDNFDSYDFSGNALFLPISYETVNNNGDYEETVFIEYVYVPDGTLWIESYKAASSNRASGLGQSLVQIIGTDGKPKVYDGDINELCKKYGVKYKEEEEK